MSHIDKIVQEAKSYIGQEEIQPNKGFKDASFADKMKAVGFYSGASWCGFFVMLVLFDVYKDSPIILNYIKKYASASTQTMWLNFRASKEVITGQIPKLGAVVIWEDGSSSNGHTGIVTWVSPDSKSFKSVEGNTNSNHSSNGFEVYENTHIVGVPNLAGFHIRGFAYMPA